jgi:PAS domain S-box-containing protein
MPLEISPALEEELRRLRQRLADLERERSRYTPSTDPAAQSLSEYYRLLYEDTPSMSFALSPDGTILSVNRFGAELLGYSTETLVGKSVLTVFDPREHHTVRQQLLACAQNPYKIFQWEIQKVHRSGRRMWVRETARAIRDGSGALLVLVVCEDITARRSAEEERRAALDALQVLIHTSPLAIMALDEHGDNVTLWNRAAERMFGWSEEEVLGHPAPFLTADHRADSDRLWNELIDRGQLLGVELRRVRRDGTPIDLSLWATAIKDREGKVTGTFGLLADITERKRAEQELRMVRGQLQHLMASSPAVIYSARASGDYRATYVSQNVLEHLGYAPRDFTEVPDFWAAHIHPDDRPGVLADLSRLFQEGHHVAEYRFLHKDGRYRWLHDRLKLLHDLAGNPLEIIGSWIDITEEKRAEEALRRSEQDLRQALAERERLSQDLHDNLLQSLYAVGMGLDLTKQRIQGSSQTDAKRLEDSVAQLNAVIREVRNFIPRMQAPTVRTGNLAHELRSLVSSFAATGAGDIALSIDDEAARRLFPDQNDHILAIAKEALSNSIRHAKAAHRSCILGLHRGKIRLEIADDGEGFQLRKTGTLGMGLTNMRSRATKLNARLVIRTALKKGTRMTLDLRRPA